MSLGTILIGDGVPHGALVGMDLITVIGTILCILESEERASPMEVMVILLRSEQAVNPWQGMTGAIPMRIATVTIQT